MRFLFLTTHYFPHVFGAELFAQKLAESLVAIGHAVDVVTGKWESAWKRMEIIGGVNVHRIDSPHIRYVQTMLYTIPLKAKIDELMKKNSYDVVHAHIYPALLVGYQYKSDKTKTTVTIQGGDLADYSEIYGPAAPLIKPVIGHALKEYDVVHAVSHDLSQTIKAMSGKIAIVIPNGVDIPLEKTTRSNKNPQVFFSSSRLTDKNNLEETIRALKIVRKTHNVTLEIAGSGHLESHLKKITTELEMDNAVTFLGPLSHDQVLSRLMSIDGFIRVSLKEGFGIAILEAMAYQVPVIASQAGGLKDFVSQSNAWIPKKPYASDIATAWIKCLESNQSTKTTNAFETAKRYDWARITKRCHQELYGF